MATSTTTPRAPSRVGSVAGELRSATRREHESAEAAMDAPSLRHPGRLADVLLGWSWVWHAVHRAATGPAACTTARAELLDPASEALVWLAADLADLARHRPSPVGLPAAPDPVLRDLLTAPAGSWGVAYVLRGSRLGGSVLAPQVSAGTGLVDGRGTTYLRSAGTDPGREWVAFRRRLDATGWTPDQLADAVQATRWTFGWVASLVVGSHSRLGEAVR